MQTVNHGYCLNHVVTTFRPLFARLFNIVWSESVGWNGFRSSEQLIPSHDHTDESDDTLSDGWESWWDVPDDSLLWPSSWRDSLSEVVPCMMSLPSFVASLSAACSHTSTAGRFELLTTHESSRDNCRLVPAIMSPPQKVGHVHVFSNELALNGNM